MSVIYDYDIQLRFPDSYNPADPVSGTAHIAAAGHVEVPAPAPVEGLRAYLLSHLAADRVGERIEIVRCAITRREEGQA